MASYLAAKQVSEVDKDLVRKIRHKKGSPQKDQSGMKEDYTGRDWSKHARGRRHDGLIHHTILEEDSTDDNGF